jgi:chemotaxis protein MotB
VHWILRVDGHTDAATDKGRDGWRTSQERALAVVAHLVREQGIPPGNLSANGFGHNQPLYSGNTSQGRAANQRIQLQITPK